MNLKTSLNQLIKKKREEKGKKAARQPEPSLYKEPMRLTESEGHGAVGGMLPLASPFGNPNSRAGGAGPNCTLGWQQERGTAEQGPHSQEVQRLADLGILDDLEFPPLPSHCKNNTYKAGKQQQKDISETHRMRHSSHSNLNPLLIKNRSSVPIYFPFLI